MALRDGIVKGSCENMCPEKEIKMREKEGLLHTLEIVRDCEKLRYPKADPRKTVKKYSRSAAGQPMPKPSDLRTPQALKKTISYLLNDVITVEDYNWYTLYDFIFDRLCAVRQDAVIQDLNIEHSIEIMKPIVRFLAYSGYRMCEESIQRYDPAINLRHFTECLRKLLSLYDDFDYQSTRAGSDFLCQCERSQFEALYLVTFLGSEDAINRGLKLNKQLRTPIVNAALQMSIAHYVGNYIRVCRMLKDLPPLLMCSAALHLPVIRRNALFVMSIAFNSHSLKYPVKSLKSDLLYEDENEVREECSYYGLQLLDKDILFQKDVFKDNIPVRSLQQHMFINKAMDNCIVPDLLTKCSHLCK